MVAANLCNLSKREASFAKGFCHIGSGEAEDSIELAKEILKALYQLKALIARLQARKSS
jgi:hypothetical protein